MGQGSPPVLGPDDVRGLLARLGPVAQEITLIGGQALNFWAERYNDREPDLARTAPHTSKDIDFYGQVEDVQKCADALGGTPTFYRLEERTACAGVVEYDQGSIDIVCRPRGVQLKNLLDRRVPFERVCVMHPLDVLLSRVANVVEIPRIDEHSIKQMRVAVVVMKAFSLDLLDQGQTKAVHKLAEQVFDLAQSANGLRVYLEHDVDLFNAVAFDDRLPEKFRTIRYPQMKARLANIRTSKKANA